MVKVMGIPQDVVAKINEIAEKYGFAFNADDDGIWLNAEFLYGQFFDDYVDVSVKIYRDSEGYKIRVVFGEVSVNETRKIAEDCPTVLVYPDAYYEDVIYDFEDELREMGYDVEKLSEDDVDEAIQALIEKYDKECYNKFRVTLYGAMLLSNALNDYEYGPLSEMLGEIYSVLEATGEKVDYVED